MDSVQRDTSLKSYLSTIAPVKVLFGPIALQADSKDSVARPQEKSVKPQGQVHIDTGQNSNTARDKDDNTELSETRQRVQKNKSYWTHAWKDRALDVVGWGNGRDQGLIEL